MRTIIAGSRHLTDSGLLFLALAVCGWTPTTVLSGGCRGADRLGAAWARRRGIPVEPYPAEDYGRWPSCGPRRNQAMVDRAEALIAVDLGGPGTADVVRRARKAGLRVFVLAPEHSRPEP